MTGPDYESFEDAWQSGYYAALHDAEHYLLMTCPWWVPRAIWKRAVAALDRAASVRGDDL